MKTLNIIGCGKVGTTLAALWHQSSTFAIGDILNRSAKSALTAVQTIDAGRAITGIEQMHAADVFLIGTPDDALLEGFELLCDSGLLGAGNVVFHCSGPYSSAVFAKALDVGAHVASVHPIKSFPQVDFSPDSLTGVYCGAEGSLQALSILNPAFAALRAKWLPIDSNSKMIYHAAAVMASNNLTALIELSLQAYEKAGINRQQAAQLMKPIVTNALDNSLTLGPEVALTGPIARGDHQLVETQLAELDAWNAQFAEAYRSLGKVALSLSRKRGIGSTASLDRLKKHLS